MTYYCYIGQALSIDTQAIVKLTGYPEMRPSTSKDTQPLAIYECHCAERSNECARSVGVLPWNT